MWRSVCAALSVVCASTLAWGQPPNLTADDLDELAKRLRYATGHIDIPGGRASMELPVGFRYLAASDARYILETVWGNPPDPDVLGLVVPPGATMPAGWAVVITYEDSGYISDDDAGDI